MKGKPCTITVDTGGSGFGLTTIPLCALLRRQKQAITTQMTIMAAIPPTIPPTIPPITVSLK